MTAGGFEEYVTARYTALVRYGVLLTADHGHGEDLVQASLVKTYRAWERLHPGGDPDAYTRRVMVRAAWRAQRRLWRREMPVAQLPDTAAADPFESTDVAHVVLRALRALPAQQRVVLVLKYWAELPEQDIADQLGCALGTVKSRANRALATLRTGPLADMVAAVPRP
jgi:RNA polymerase sigma-70 factor (sigma-E family)